MSAPMAEAGLTPTRRALLPDAALPRVYFAGAHAALALALAVLVWRPELPGPFHYHPAMIALVHLVTLGWISGSILGAFYIVAPLALGLPLPAGRADRAACASFWIGTTGMVGGFWFGELAVTGVTSLLVLAPIAWVGLRAAHGLRTARVPRAIALHVQLAFANMVIAGGLGLAMALNRTQGWWAVSPLDLAAAHAHLAVLGWATMMIIGLAYRLVPMFLPGAMPVGRGLFASAILLEAGTLGLPFALLTGTPRWPAIVCVLGAFVCFAVQARRIVANRRTRPAGMVGRDWASWQTHAALLHVPVACGLGIWMTAAGASSTALPWAYVTVALLGFVAQMVVGIQGRLLPIHAWYRDLARRGGSPPPYSAHRLILPGRARLVFLLWLAGVTSLVVGLSAQILPLIRMGAAAILAATLLTGTGLFATTQAD